MHLHPKTKLTVSQLLSGLVTLVSLAMPSITAAQSRASSMPVPLYPPNAGFCSPASFDRCPPTMITYSAAPQESYRMDAAMARWRDEQELRFNRHRAAEESDFQDEGPRATPDAPDQSELLKNAKDPDFILHNFKTMYVQTHNIDFFDAAEMKAALVDNPDFRKLNIRIVDDRRVADTVLVVSYTFAWDYPFELRHQNTTTVLFGGKGEGPFSGPLGAADVARQFVDLAKPWRTSQAQK